MSELKIDFIKNEIDEIVNKYLYNVSSLINNDYFNKRKAINPRTKYYNCKGFPLIYGENKNEYVLNTEVFLEGCTRVFLINPIIKRLLDLHLIENEWRFDTTFSNYCITNREYENGSFIEFIALIDGKRVGFKYTKLSYRSEEFAIMERNSDYMLKKKKIPGFDKLSPIDIVCSIDWSGISEDDLSTIHSSISNGNNSSVDLSAVEFFNKIFSIEECDLIIQTTQRALEKAREFIALQAVPQLLPSNMFMFKEVVLNNFSEEAVTSFKYIFKDGRTVCGLNNFDLERINNQFFEKNRQAIIGDADFAKSFLTSEYLFNNIPEGLSIDYTAIVVGYLKSVEQLLYVLYLSAFEGKNGMEYWDKVKNLRQFNISLPQFRYEPYNPSRSWKQEKYYHDKKTGSEAPEIGKLILFLRYFEKIWNISELGKEYIYECLDDFRKYCRNSYFHKDNISYLDYDTVKIIRNNTCVCLYYLLGGFSLLDVTSSFEEQLGIIDFRFENFYNTIWRKRCRLFYIKTQNRYNGIIQYLNENEDIKYNESGMLENAELHFMKIPGYSKEDITFSVVNELINDDAYVAENGYTITRDSMPEEIEPIIPKRKKAH